MSVNITITEVADIAQNALGDAGAATWPQATVEEWVLLAIRDYGAHFSMVTATTIPCVTGIRQYALPTDFLDAIKVQYPYLIVEGTGTPGPGLQRKSFLEEDFWDVDGFYDWLPVRSAGSEPNNLFISNIPTTGENIYVVYSALYYHRDDADPTITYCRVPDQHIPVLIQYVQFLAAQERLNTELADPDRTIHLIDDLHRATRAAKQTYDEMITAAKVGTSDARQTPRWQMDQHDQIY
jgi:hypothetical protein